MKRDHDAEMAAFERQYKAGDKRVILHALAQCICSFPSKPVPPWARHVLAAAMYEITMAKVKSWDQVFDKPHKGRKIDQLRQQRQLRSLVTKRVLDLRRQKPKPKDINQTVADEFGIGVPTVKRYFEAERKRFSKSPR